MRTLVNQFASVWLTEVDARRYAVFRVALAFLVLADIVLLWPYRATLFSDAGMIDATAAREGTAGISLPVFDVFASPGMVTLLFLIAAAAAILFANGTFARPALLVVYIFLVAKIHRSPLVAAGWDFVLCNFTLIMLVSPLGEKWNLRRLKEELFKAEPGAGGTAPRYGLVLIQLQVFAIYWQTAILKLCDNYWRSGEFMGYFLLSHHGRFRGAWVAEWADELGLLTQMTLAIEFAIPLLLWIPAYRSWGIVLGIVLHGAIAIVGMNLIMFSMTMVLSYLAFVNFGAANRSGPSEGDRR